MKALVKAKAERGIWMEDIDKPRVGHNDVLIKVKRTAICGTDIHIFKWDDWAQATIPVPMAVGHEFSGEHETYCLFSKGVSSSIHDEQIRQTDDLL